jgi:predicted nucleotidyltransferase
MILDNNRVKVLSEFMPDYSSGITASSIAKKLKMNQKTVSNILNEFEKTFHLKSSMHGRNKFFYINLYDKQETSLFIMMIELQRTEKFIKKDNLLNKVLTELMKDTEDIIVAFGSMVSGYNNKNSDLDIFFVGEKFPEKVKETAKIYNIKLDIKHYSRKNFEDSLKKTDFLVEEVIKNHIILTGHERFVKQTLETRHSKYKMVLDTI